MNRLLISKENYERLTTRAQAGCVMAPAKRRKSDFYKEGPPGLDDKMSQTPSESRVEIGLHVCGDYDGMAGDRPRRCLQGICRKGSCGQKLISDQALAVESSTGSGEVTPSPFSAGCPFFSDPRIAKR